MDEQLQTALDAITNDASQSSGENAQLIAAKCRGLLRGYWARWKHDPYNVIDVEQIYTADLTNPDTNRKSRTFVVAGKLDVLAERNGGTWIIDHKTTSDEIADPSAPYWRQLAIEGQVTHYMLLQWMQGIKPEGAIWDVCRKPGISPKKLAKAERAAVVANGTYCGYRVSNESREAMTIEERETLEMYEYRLASDCIEQPERFFQRRPVPRMENEILEYARELWDHGQDILHERNKDRLPSRNSGACMLYGSPCQFLGVCSGYDTIGSSKWQRKPVLHPELGTEGDLLTNSRIRCFQTCRRKHHYQFEMGVERADQEERESLFFGTLFHVGLESLFISMKGSSDAVEYEATA